MKDRYDDPSHYMRHSTMGGGGGVSLPWKFIAHSKIEKSRANFCRVNFIARIKGYSRVIKTDFVFVLGTVRLALRTNVNYSSVLYV